MQSAASPLHRNGRNKSSYAGKMEVKKAYRMFKRQNGMFYAHHNATGTRTSLETRNAEEAKELLHAKNKAASGPILNLALGKAYLTAIDPQFATRTWKSAFEYFTDKGKEASRERWQRVMRSKPFAALLSKVIVETQFADFDAVLRAGGNFANNTLRLLQSTACGLGWLHWQVIPAKLWPKAVPKAKRAVTAEEHAKILAVEKNEERCRYYQFLWETGASQSDAAYLTADAVDWTKRTAVFKRMKTGTPVYISVGENLERLLKQCPEVGFLFPTIARTDNKARAAEFCRRLRTVKVSGISLHSYRYAWAQRARVAGYPERFAQAALGHKSRAVHQEYSRDAVVTCPALDEWQRQQENIIRLNQEPPAKEVKSA